MANEKMTEIEAAIFQLLRNMNYIDLLISYIERFKIEEEDLRQIIDESLFEHRSRLWIVILMNQRLSNQFIEQYKNEIFTNSTLTSVAINNQRFTINQIIKYCDMSVDALEMFLFRKKFPLSECLRRKILCKQLVNRSDIFTEAMAELNKSYINIRLLRIIQQ